MSRNNGKASKLELLRMGLSRARGGPSATARPGGDSGSNGRATTSPRRVSSSSSSTASPPSSCVSSEGSPDAAAAAPAPMVLAGCPRCMMYVMLSREDPRCPRCHNAVLLDFSEGDQRRPRQRR
ncbi:uncharacterized protein [Zea mays]|uniref:GIR1-like zinc ribbon domain-containing protein n=1 Tax=Zea mays TaxID=4577 RepID=A0A1D6N6J9_MAIZE|nr:uncharacterized protein LOC100277613 [Zea mays]ONM36223.1 hypothetical protein ZEAMMB73_Zm00001d042754 [Zea mays]|eukprot:XP_008672623.1 uncharacterized protein LOC100277613 [Zea mays]